MKLKEEAIKEIQFIFDNIKSGKFKHNQRNFHCGTAHCIAGWHELIKYYNPIFNKPIEEVEDVELESYIHGVLNRKTFYIKPNELAKKDWELSNTEAEVLFNGESSFYTQKKLLECFKLGFRLRDYSTVEFLEVSTLYFNADGILGLIDPEYEEVILDTSLDKNIQALSEAKDFLSRI